MGELETRRASPWNDNFADAVTAPTQRGPYADGPWMRASVNCNGRPPSPVAGPLPAQPQITPQLAPLPTPALKVGGQLLASSCPEHPEEPATYFCATCECACICAECIVHGVHRGHDVLRVGKAHEALRARAGTLLDEALALEDEFAVVTDKLTWRRKEIERAAARGRASVRSAFARVRAQLADRETELLDSLDTYERDTLQRLEKGTADHDYRLGELSKLQESLRSRCRSGDAVEALNAYANAKLVIDALRSSFRHDEISIAGPPDEFIGLAGSARAE